jgi:chaperonin cofactor prefoldin
MREGIGELVGAVTALGTMFFGWVTYSSKQQKEATEKLDKRIEILEGKIDILQDEKMEMQKEIERLKVENAKLEVKVKELNNG